MSDPFAPPPLRMPRNVQRPPLQRKPPVTPTGPRLYRQTRRNVVRIGGPGAAPPEFLRQSTSYTEWIWYWASKRALDPDQDPRMPPFEGGRLWQYQSPELGSYTRAPGSAVVDFLYMVSYPFLAVRIQTFRFHLATTSLKQERDRQQLVSLGGSFDVVDIYEQDFLGDETGQTAVVMVKEAVGLIRRQDPLTAGGTRLVRSPMAR